MIQIIKKRPSLIQLNIFLLVLYIMCLSLLALSVSKFIRDRNNWIESNADNIKEYSATVIGFTKEYRRMLGDVEIIASNGDHVILKSEYEKSGIIDVYCISINDKKYYAFSKEELFLDIRQTYAIMSNIIRLILLFGPMALYAGFREFYGYPIIIRKRNVTQN